MRYELRGRLDAISRTSTGGIKAVANLTRTGVFEYRDANGEPFFEYRPPEEVFAQRSLDSMRGVPLCVGHPAEVNAGNWRALAVGHVGDDAHPNGEFVTATVYIQDAETCLKVESGELREISMGYEVDLEMTAGVTEDGERYDAIQRNPRYNHAAVGPFNWGRAGTEVRIQLDAADGESIVDRARRECHERHLNAWRR